MPNKARREREKRAMSRRLAMAAEANAAVCETDNLNAERKRADLSEGVLELLAKADALIQSGGVGGTSRGEALRRSDCALIRQSIINGWQTSIETRRANVAKLVEAVLSDHRSLSESAIGTLQMMDDRELLDGVAK